MTEFQKCDFCATGEPVYKMYNAVDFVHDCLDAGIVKLASRDNWCACKTCADLIEAESWERLADRAIDSYMQKYPLPEGMRLPLREEIKRCHQEFQDHRRMEA